MLRLLHFNFSMATFPLLVQTILDQQSFCQHLLHHKLESLIRVVKCSVSFMKSSVNEPIGYCIKKRCKSMVALSLCHVFT